MPTKELRKMLNIQLIKYVLHALEAALQKGQNLFVVTIAQEEEK